MCGTPAWLHHLFPRESQHPLHHAAHIGVSLSRAPELSWGTSAIATHKLGMCVLRKAKQKPETWVSPQMGTSSMYVGDGYILAAPKPHWRPWGLPMPFIHITSAAPATQLLLSLLRVPGGAWGVPGVSWSRLYLLPFIFQGRSAFRAELGESRPPTGPSSWRARHGLWGRSHAWELAVVRRQGLANPLMLVTMRFDGEQEFVPQSCRF